MKRIVTSMSLLCCLSSPALAGPLTPPAGPVASTMKTLEQVEPRIPVSAVNTPSNGEALFEISQPGSYYLTGNINITSLPPGVTRGILISSDDVTLDLNGFSIRATPSANPSSVISVASSQRVTVKNGSIIGGSTSGITFQEFGHAENLRIRSDGLSSPGATGLKVNAPGIATECSVDGYTTGISGNGALIDSCVVSGSSVGIGIASGQARNCRVLSATGTGIAVYKNGVAFENHVTYCPTGIHLYDTGSRAYRNTVASCTTFGVRSQTATTMAFNNIVSDTPTPYSASGSKWGPVVTDLAASNSPWANVSN